MLSVFLSISSVVQMHVADAERGKICQADCHCPTFIAKSKLIQVALSLRLEITKKVSRLILHYYIILALGGQVGKSAAMVDTTETPAPPTGHMTFTQSLAVFEKNIFFFVSLSQ